MRHIQVNLYVCPTCGKQWREFRRGLRKCPACGRVLNFNMFDPKHDDVMKYAMPMTCYHKGGCVVIGEEPS